MEILIALTAVSWVLGIAYFFAKIIDEIENK